MRCATSRNALSANSRKAPSPEDGPCLAPPRPAARDHARQLRQWNRFAESIARAKGLKPPPGYATSGSICRAFLDHHAPKKAGGELLGVSGSKPASPAQMLFAEK